MLDKNTEASFGRKPASTLIHTPSNAPSPTVSADWSFVTRRLKLVFTVMEK